MSIRADERPGTVLRALRRAAVAVVLGIALFGSTAVHGSVAEASIPGRTVLTFNMFGFNGGGGPVNSYSSNAIVASLQNRNPLPLVVTLTEVCLQQLTNNPNMNLWANMTALGFTLVAVQAPVNPGGNCGGFGVVTFARGPQLGTYVADYGGQNGFLACASTNAGLGPYFACAAHLSSNPADAGTQWGQLLTDINNYKLFMPVLWAGDLNMDAIARNCDAGTSKYNAAINGLFWPGGYAETDADGPPLTTRKTWKYSISNKSCHLDYIGYDRAIWRADPASTRVSPPSSLNVSDHYIYEGSPLPR